MVTRVTCPTCQKEVEWGPQSPYRPFCCKRCQLIDLGEWASEEKRIPGGESDTPPDFDDESSSI
ncbi:MAG: DNA gyrase inhibitor YacG [Aeromonas sp.]